MSTNRRSLGIRAKTLLALALTLGFGIVVLVLTLRGFLLNGFLRSESEQVRQAFGAVSSQIDSLLSELEETAAGYASGDEVQRLQAGALPGSPRGDAFAARLANDHIALAALIDGAGRLAGGFALDPASRVFAPLPPALAEYLRGAAAPVVRGSSRVVIRGIVPLGGWPLLVVSRPLTRGGSAGAEGGTLVLGRHLDRSLLLRLATSAGAPDLIFAGIGAQTAPETREALAALAAGEGVFIRRPNAQIMTGYTLLRDIAGRPAFVLRVHLDRAGYASGMLSLKILMVAFGLVLLATGATYILLIERTVLRRVIRLGETVRQVGAGAVPAEGIVADGPDEIGTLTEQVRAAFVSGQLLKRELEESRQALERRVEERTRDLTDTVDALGREVEVRRAAEAQVRELEQQQRAIIDNMVGGLVAFDENLAVTRVNPAALRLLRSAPSCVGRPLAGLLPASFAAEIAGAFRSAEPALDRRETRAAFADGRELAFGYVVSRIPAAEGRGAQGIVLFRDLTVEVRLAAEQQRLNRLTTLGEFSAQLAHELRNPLTAMSSSVQYLAAASAGHDRELLRILTESIERMEGIIRRMRMFSREMPLARTRVDLGDLLAHLLLFLEASLREQLIAPVFHRPAAPVFVTCDPAQLHQALLNLLLNAMQAMPRGGRLRLRLARGRTPADGGPGPVLALIADSGLGIAPEVAGRIFDPFYTTREAGTGLGLPIADKIVREHGGTIRFTSRPGHGACFAVLLPGAS